ncbi:MAG: hypothetical protein WC726_04035 [Parcubacteria group bacterium]
MFKPKHEKLYIILFFAVLAIILTWPTAWHFFSSVPSSGSDTMQVIGVAGDKANLIAGQGFFKGTFELIKRSEFNVTTIYAYFQLIFGRVAGYNLLFFISFILSGFGAYLFALYFTKNKPASLIAGIIFAFAPFHIHNAMSTNAGTMHQEWLPFFVLYLFRFFNDLKFRNFVLSGLFLFLIGFTEHQLLAFTVVFIFFFLVYNLITEPKLFLRGKFWLYAGTSAIVLSVLFFIMFRSLFTIAGSGNNYLDAGLKSAVKYSNDTLSIFVPPNFHTFWSNAFSHLRNQFERNFDSSFSDYAGYLVMLLSLIAILAVHYFKKNKLPSKGIWFWLAVTIGFYVLSLGPYLHYKGVLDPPIKMPYWFIYQYLPFYKNIRTVGRLFVFSMLGFSVLAAWGMAFINSKFSKNKNSISEEKDSNGWELNKRSKILYCLAGLIIILEFLAIPLKTDSLLHSSFYEKLGQDKEKYSVLEVPGSTDYDFASRDLVWKSIHQKTTINGFDFARVNKEGYMFQRGTPIIRTLLYDIPGGSNGNDRDIVKNAYYIISSEILNFYNIRWVILDKTALKGDPAKGDSDLSYSAKAYVASVIKCADVYEDEYLYACKIDQSDVPEHMFLAMDYSNDHWMGKSESKNGLQRWAENGAGMKIVNMTSQTQKSRLNFNLKIDKPMRLKVFFNGQEVFNQYITAITQKQSISAELPNILPGENEIIFGVYAADNSEIRSDKKSDTARIYQVEVE